MSEKMLQSDMDRLQERLHELESQRPRIAEDLKAARAEGTEITENAALLGVAEEQVQLENAINKLTERITKAVIVQESQGGKVGLGSLVTVSINNKEKQFRLVGADANVGGGEVNASAPVGKALLGAQAGETVAAVTPKGLIKIRVLRVK